MRNHYMHTTTRYNHSDSFFDHCAVMSLMMNHVCVTLWCLCGMQPPFYDPNVHIMYQKILSAPLLVPASFSAPACDILRKVSNTIPASLHEYAKVSMHVFLHWRYHMHPSCFPFFSPYLGEKLETHTKDFMSLACQNTRVICAGMMQILACYFTSMPVVRERTV